MTNKNFISLIGYASGIAAGDPGCGDGPVVLEKSNIIKELQSNNISCVWDEILHPGNAQSNLAVVATLCEKLANRTCDLTKQQKLFTTIGGDHSCAIGTWSGVAHAITQACNTAQNSIVKDIGLIWFDAHMDSHTPETSETGNIHGMPLACLLGYGPKELTHILSTTPTLKPQNVCLIGIRSYEKGEAELIQKLGVRVYDMDEVHQRGLKAIVAEAKERVTKNTIKFGVSIDLDSMDPIDVPGTGTPEPNGFRAHELYAALEEFISHDERFLGAEIVEFNPHHDVQDKTLAVIKNLLQVLFKT